MRVLAVNSLQPGEGRPAWAGTFVSSQIRSLAERGVQIEEHAFDTREAAGNPIKALQGIAARIRATRASLVHAHYGTLTAFMARCATSVPLVISFCGSDLLGDRVGGAARWKATAGILLSQLAALGAQQVIVKSRELQSALWIASRAKSTIIPNGVDLDRFRPTERSEARKRLGWSQDERIVLFNDGGGNPAKRKGLALQVYAEVRNRVKGSALRIMGNVAPADVPLWLSASDVLLVTSLYEGSPNVVKEALACNLPIVSVTCGDVAERLERVRNSRVVPDDPNRLSSAVVEILDRRERSDGRSRIEELSLDRVANRVLQVYAEALGRSPELLSSERRDAVGDHSRIC